MVSVGKNKNLKEEKSEKIHKFDFFEYISLFDSENKVLEQYLSSVRLEGLPKKIQIFTDLQILNFAVTQFEKFFDLKIKKNFYHDLVYFGSFHKDLIDSALWLKNI